MGKSVQSKLMAAIPAFLAIEGALLILYAFFTGADLLAVIFTIMDSNYPCTVKDFYVLIGFLRTALAVTAIRDVKKKPASVDAVAKRGIRIVAGSFFLFCSLAGIGLSLLDGSVTAGIVVECVVTFVPSLYYFIHALKRDAG